MNRRNFLSTILKTVYLDIVLHLVWASASIDSREEGLIGQNEGGKD